MDCPGTPDTFHSCGSARGFSVRSASRDLTIPIGPILRTEMRSLSRSRTGRSDCTSSEELPPADVSSALVPHHVDQSALKASTSTEPRSGIDLNAIHAARHKAFASMNAVTVVEEAAIEGTQPETVVSKASHVDERGAEASASPASSAAAQDTLDASKSGTAVEGVLLEPIVQNVDANRDASEEVDAMNSAAAIAGEQSETSALKADAEQNYVEDVKEALGELQIHASSQSNVVSAMVDSDLACEEPMQSRASGSDADEKNERGARMASEAEEQSLADAQVKKGIVTTTRAVTPGKLSHKLRAASKKEEVCAKVAEDQQSKKKKLFVFGKSPMQSSTIQAKK